MIVYKIEPLQSTHRSGGSSTPKPQESVSGGIVKDLYAGGKGPLATSLYSILNPTGDDAYAQLAAKRLSSQVGSAYGRAGLSGSGISIQGQTDALANLDAQLAQQKYQEAAQIFSAGTGAPTYAPQQQPRGLFGLK